jgi:[acyl-carrier-protein] S-malonyltransferase
MPGQLSERAGMARPLQGHPLFQRLAGGFNALTAGQFERWVTTASQEEISERFTAPAIMVLFDVLCGELAVEVFGPPAALAGYSLGFYAAGVVAKCVSPQAVLGWLTRVNASNARAFPPGAFSLAVSTGVAPQALRAAFEQWGQGGLEIANVNNPSQVVFAGPAAEVADAVGRLRGVALDVRALPLDVPLHTPYLEGPRSEVMSWWSLVPASTPLFPLLSPATGKVIRSGAGFKQEVLSALALPTDWVAVVRGLEAQGIRTLLDLSPQGDLGRMARWTCRDMEVLPVSALWEEGG